MEKPFLVCHMFVSMNGKIDGAFMNDPSAFPARTEYGKLRSFYNSTATIYGTVTMSAFADGPAPKNLPKAEAGFPREDYAAPHEGEQYEVAADPEGCLAWNTGYHERAGRGRSHVIEALTEKVSSDYLAYLRAQGVSYVIAGKKHLDCPLLLHKLKTLFGIERAIVAGGGGMNASFLQEDLIDEVSIVVAPTADGNTQSASVFERGAFLPARAPAAFSLLSVQRVAGDGLWLRYALKKEKNEQSTNT